MKMQAAVQPPLFLQHLMIYIWLPVVVVGVSLLAF